MDETARRLIADFIVNRCRDDPFLFNEVILRGLPLWSGKARGFQGQREWLELFLKYQTLVVAAGNNLGKSLVTSQVLIPWWSITRPGSLVVVFAPSFSVLQENTWVGLRKAFEGYTFQGKSYRPAIDLGAKVSKGGNAIPSVTLPNNSRILGIASTEEERCSGHHNPDLLVVVEEASGIRDFVWSAIAGLGAKKIWIIGNPLSTDCGFYEKYRLGLQHARLGTPPERATCSIVVPSLASPHIDQWESPWGIANKSWLENFKIEHGEQSYQYRTKVMAQFPESEDENVIDRESLQYAMSEEAKASAQEFRQRHGSRIVIACDVGQGKGRSKSVIVVRDDFGVLELLGLNLDPYDTADRIAMLKAKYNISDTAISYDANGDTGSNMKQALRNRGIIHAWEYFGGSTAVKECGPYYANARTATAYIFARRLRKERLGDLPKDAPFHIPADHKDHKIFVEEFQALRGVFQGDGKTALENKQHLQDRLKRSPDYLDAFTQSFCREAAGRL